MMENNFIKLFIIIFLQCLFCMVIDKLTKRDNNCDLKLTSKYFIISSFLIIILFLFDLQILVICQFIIMFWLSYMDLKLKKVYSMLIIILFFLSIIIGLKNIDSYCLNYIYGVCFVLLAFLKIYAKADGLVMFCIVQGLSLNIKEYYICALIAFFFVQMTECINYFLAVFLKKEESSKYYSQPVIPSITFVYYILQIISK